VLSPLKGFIGHVSKVSLSSLHLEVLASFGITCVNQLVV